MRASHQTALTAVIIAALPILSAAPAAAAEGGPLQTLRQTFGADQAADDCSRPSPISTYKINYFSLNTWPGRDKAQVKFQVSAKYKFLDRDWSLQGRPLALYLAYSQKSLWNVGQESMPFEESNYNPEAFLGYHLNKAWGLFTIRDIVLSPYEHESNGMAGPTSRSWNRLYAAVRLG